MTKQNLNILLGHSISEPSSPMRTEVHPVLPPPASRISPGQRIVFWPQSIASYTLLYSTNLSLCYYDDKIRQNLFIWFCRIYLPIYNIYRKLEISIIYYTFEAIRRKYKFKKPYRSKIILERLILMNTLSNIISGDYSTRGLVLGRYYPITSEEAETLIRKGLGKDLINFVSDRGYTLLYLIMI